LLNLTGDRSVFGQCYAPPDGRPAHYRGQPMYLKHSKRRNKMNIIIYLIVAAVIGWVATEIMHDRSNLLINIIVAVVGAFLAGYFLSPLFHVGTINDAITIPTMLVTLLGAIILLAIVHLVRRRR
jgi:uncharacterized membrane protein YeaQ/YmgE (transglycosylase-associated protein family)